MMQKYITSLTLLFSFSLFIAGQQIQKPLFIFAHGMWDSKKKADEYKEILDGYVFSFNFDDALSFPALHKPFTTCFAQETEIEKLEKIYSAAIKYFETRNLPIPPIILVGLSRGASAILNFLATKKPKYVQGVILESPFDHVEHVLQHNFSFCYSLLRPLFSLIFRNYNKNGLQPMHYIQKIDKTIPILFITSTQDQRVPHYATMILYHFLKHHGHQKLFLKIFEKGRHAKILKNNKKEYKETVQEFLKNI